MFDRDEGVESFKEGGRSLWLSPGSVTRVISEPTHKNPSLSLQFIRRWWVIRRHGWPPEVLWPSLTAPYDQLSAGQQKRTQWEKKEGGMRVKEMESISYMPWDTQINRETNRDTEQIFHLLCGNIWFPIYDCSIFSSPASKIAVFCVLWNFSIISNIQY